MCLLELKGQRKHSNYAEYELNKRDGHLTSATCKHGTLIKANRSDPRDLFQERQFHKILVRILSAGQ